MSVIAVVGIKGGVGKTTLSIQLAAARADMTAEDGRPRRVLLIDTDPQRASENSISNRREDLPPIACLHFNSAKNCRQQAPNLFPKYDDSIIDLAGSDNQMLHLALTLAETIVIPCAPRAYEIWSLDDIIELIVESNSLRAAMNLPPLKAIVVMNMVGPGPRQIEEGIKRAGGAAGEIVKKAAGNGDDCEIYFAKTGIRRRQVISVASSFGISVRHASGGARNAPAVAEIDAMVQEVFSR